MRCEFDVRINKPGSFWTNRKKELYWLIQKTEAERIERCLWFFIDGGGRLVPASVTHTRMVAEASYRKKLIRSLRNIAKRCYEYCYP
jgi:hypothetical protein